MAFTPTAEWLDEVFLEEVAPDLFDGLERSGTPTALLLGAQPGAGKTRAAQFAKAAEEGVERAVGILRREPARTHAVARAMADDASVQAAWELLDADQVRLAATAEGP